MGVNNNNLKQYNVQHYAGPVSELPAKLPFGDFYFAEDIEILYKYNYQGLPISLGAGIRYDRVEYFSELEDGDYVGDLAYVDYSEGTAWLPGTAGGTYNSKGWYLWTGTLWESNNSAVANQFQTNINSLNTKVDKVEGYSLSKNDLTDILKASYSGSVNWINTNGNNLINHTFDNSNPHNVTSTQVGLGNVDNTSDINKPTSTATLSKLDLKVDKVSGERLINSLEITKLGNQEGINTGDQDISIKVDKVVGYSLTKNNLTDTLKSAYDNAVGWILENGSNLISHLSSSSNPHSVNKSQVGLGEVTNTDFTDTIALNTDKVSDINHITIELPNVDNTSDLNKPISTATQSALDEKPNESHGHIKADIVDFIEEDYATAIQGAKADTSLQSGDSVSLLLNDSDYIESNKLLTDKDQDIIGTRDGVNTEFQLVNSYIQGTTRVFLNGQRLYLGLNLDYTEEQNIDNSKYNLIDFIEPIEVDDRILVDYVKN